MSISYADLFAKFLSGAPAPGTNVVYNPWSETAPNDTRQGTLVPGTTGMYQGATQNFGYGPGQGSQSVTGTRGSNITNYDPQTGRLYFNMRFLTNKPRVVAGLFDVTTGQYVVDPSNAAGIGGAQGQYDAKQGGWMAYPYLSGSNINSYFQLPGPLDPNHTYTMQIALPMEGGVGSDINDPATHPQFSGAQAMGLPAPPANQQIGQVGQQAQQGFGAFPQAFQAPGAAGVGLMLGQAGGGTTPAAGGTQQYNTVSGLRTISQMATELKNVGWQGNPTDANAVIAAYQSTAKSPTTGQTGTVTPASTLGTAATNAGITGGTADQLAAGIQKLLESKAAGDKAAFDEAVREFNATFGLDQAKFQQDINQFNQTFGITQAGVTGQYQGQPTLQALTSWANQFGTYGQPTLGQQTLAAQQQAYAQQLGLVSQAASMQANPFRQAQVIGQANKIMQGMPAASFAAPNTVAGVGTAGGNTQGGMGYLQQMIDDIRNPTPNQTTADAFLQQTPTPNKIDSSSFLRSAPSTQNIVLQAMQEKYGLDPKDSLAQIQATLPQFQAPTTFGGVRR